MSKDPISVDQTRDMLGGLEARLRVKLDDALRMLLRDAVENRRRLTARFGWLTFFAFLAMLAAGGACYYCYEANAQCRSIAAILNDQLFRINRLEALQRDAATTGTSWHSKTQEQWNTMDASLRSVRGQLERNQRILYELRNQLDHLKTKLDEQQSRAQASREPDHPAPN